MNEEQMIKLALKHKLAMAYSVELVSLGRDVPTIVDRSFDLAEDMIKRMDEELATLTAKTNQADHQEDAMDRDMFAILEALAKHFKA